jgi:hypothetical protein
MTLPTREIFKDTPWGKHRLACLTPIFMQLNAPRASELAQYDTAIIEPNKIPAFDITASWENPMFSLYVFVTLSITSLP